MAHFATVDRKKNVADRASQEKSLWMQNTFAEAIFTDTFPGSVIEIFVQIHQADGSELAAAITAASLALIDAGVPMRELVVPDNLFFVGT